MSELRFGDSAESVLAAWSSDLSLAICIPDHTRPMDVSTALEAVVKCLTKTPRVVVGLGLHRQMTSEELAPIQSWNPIQHDPDDVVYVGQSGGIQGFVSRAVCEADAALIIGLVELHQYAGFSSGYKGIVVGCGGRETIRQLHRRELVLSKGVCVGQLEGNPFRMHIDAIGAQSNARWALVYVPALKCWAFGEPKALIAAIAEKSQPWMFLNQRYKRAIVRVPSCKQSSLYQASRAASYLALSPSPPLLHGAEIIIEAPLEEGLGAERGFVTTMEASIAPWSELLSGPEPTGAGAQRAVILALMAQKVTLVLRGCHNPGYFQQLGFNASEEKARLDAETLLVDNIFERIPQWREN